MIKLNIHEAKTHLSRYLDRLLEVRALGVTRVGASRTADILNEAKRRLEENS